MFDLVDDVEAYPRFLHWCPGAAVQNRTEDEVVASVDVGLGGIRKRFTTRNRLMRPERIELDLVDGPFKTLRGAWTFEEVAGGCTVSLNLDFEVAHTPLDMMFATVFEEIVRSQVSAFVKRAKTVYG